MFPVISDVSYTTLRDEPWMKVLVHGFFTSWYKTY